MVFLVMNADVAGLPDWKVGDNTAVWADLYLLPQSPFGGPPVDDETPDDLRGFFLWSGE